VRIERLRWLRQALNDPEECTRETEVDGAVVRVVRANGGQVDMRVDPQELSDRLDDLETFAIEVSQRQPIRRS
jgi:hypothetical protein